MKFLRNSTIAIFFAFVVSATDMARATIFEIDLFNYGDSLITRDTDTGLDWLDLSLLKNVVYNDLYNASNKFFNNVNPISDLGFRHATFNEVVQFVQNFGLDVLNLPGFDLYGTDIWLESIFQQAVAFNSAMNNSAGLLGIGIRGITSTPHPTNPGNIAFTLGYCRDSTLQTECRNTGSGNFDLGYTNGHFFTLNNNSNNVSHYLVRSSASAPPPPSPVPEPATLTIFGIGLAGLASLRSRRWVKPTGSA